MEMPSADEILRSSFHSVEQQIALYGGGVRVARLRHQSGGLPVTARNMPEDAMEIISQLADFGHHRLFKNGVLLFDGGHPMGTLAITDLREAWQCQHLSSFDNVRFKVSSKTLRAFLFENGASQYETLRCKGDTIDFVVLGLAQALLPALEARDESNRLFMDHIIFALLSHVTRAYGGLQFPDIGKGRLSAWQQRRATEMLVDLDGAAMSTSDLALACGLSRSHFIKAFKLTFGRTPYRWLLEYKVSKVQEQLRAGTPLAHIASELGFSDQSHMTRVFRQIVGEAPGSWRRNNIVRSSL